MVTHHERVEPAKPPLNYLTCLESPEGTGRWLQLDSTAHTETAQRPALQLESDKTFFQCTLRQVCVCTINLLSKSIPSPLVINNFFKKPEWSATYLTVKLYGRGKCLNRTLQVSALKSLQVRHCCHSRFLGSYAKCGGLPHLSLEQKKGWVNLLILPWLSKKVSFLKKRSLAIKNTDFFK